MPQAPRRPLCKLKAKINIKIEYPPDPCRIGATPTISSDKCQSGPFPRTHGGRGDKNTQKNVLNYSPMFRTTSSRR